MNKVFRITKKLLKSIFREIQGRVVVVTLGLLVSILGLFSPRKTLISLYNSLDESGLDVFLDRFEDRE